MWMSGMVADSRRAMPALASTMTPA
jgi:hypothetical protein